MKISIGDVLIKLVYFLKVYTEIKNEVLSNQSISHNHETHSTSTIGIEIIN